MRSVQILAAKSQRSIASRCEVADSFGSRLVGLMGRAELAPGEGLWLPKCNNIHMWFMRIPLDVVFVRPAPGGTDGRFTVTSTRPGVRPWKLLPVADFGATDTLELPVGTVLQAELQAGDELCFV